MSESETQNSARRAVAYLTGTFELRPSRRKAAALERRRALCERTFWEVLSRNESVARAALDGDRKSVRTAVATIESDALRTALAKGLSEPIAQGLARDIGSQVSSYIELKRTRDNTQWPSPQTGQAIDEAAIDRLARAITLDDENTARDEMLRCENGPKLKPFTLARSRDVRILRKADNGSLIVALNILRSKDADARAIVIEAGVDASTGEAVARKVTKTCLVIPISCSKWHENKFLSGRAELKSGLVFRRGERWFLNAQFAFTVETRATTHFLGVDRGLVNLVSCAAVQKDGCVARVLPIAGNDVAEAIRTCERKARAHQKRKARSIPLHHRRSQHILHQVSNRIVREAKAHGAQVVVESLTGLKKTITTPREKFARKGGWRKALKTAQLGKLEAMLDYKLRLEGLPGVKTVPAGGTSQTCTACGHRDRENRTERDLFRCVACGFSCDADMNAAVQIARRGVMKVSKGDKMIDLHLNMVAALKGRVDAGLGPLATGVANGFVAGQVAAISPNEKGRGNALPLNGVAGQNAQPMRSKSSKEDSGRADRSEYSALRRREMPGNPRPCATSVADESHSGGECNSGIDAPSSDSVADEGHSGGECN